MAHAKESKTILRLRRKLKRRLREESKAMKKSVLKRISQVIRLRFDKQLLDTHTVDVVEGRHANLSSVEMIQNLRTKIHKDSDRISRLSRETFKIKTLI